MQNTTSYPVNCHSIESIQSAIEKAYKQGIEDGFRKGITTGAELALPHNNLQASIAYVKAAGYSVFNGQMGGANRAMRNQQQGKEQYQNWLGQVRSKVNRMAPD